MSVDEFLDRMPIIQRFILQPSSLRHENETVDFITFRMENISLAVRGMSVDTVKLEIPQKLDNMTMNGLQSDNTEIGDCVAQFWAAYGDETKLKMTDSIRSELLNQKQTSTTICVYVVRNIVTKDYRYYKSPALVIYLRDPVWKISTCKLGVESNHGDFNTTVEMTSSVILGSGKCCSMNLNILDVRGMVKVFIKINGTEETRLRLSSRKADVQKYFIGRKTDIFKIVLNYDSNASKCRRLNISWKNCNSIKEAIRTTLSDWSYREPDFTIYDDFCDCNNLSLQTFYCKGPGKGLVLRTAKQLTRITSNTRTSSNVQCHLSLVMTTTFKTYIGIAIFSHNGTRFHVFNQEREGFLYEQYRQRFNFRIGRIEDKFHVRVDLKRLEGSSLLAIESVKLNNCSGISRSDSQLNCSLSEYKCKSGVCVDKWKRCNLAKDCFHGDDEENCERDLGRWQCDFDVSSNKTCSFLQYKTNRCGRFRIKQGSLYGSPGPEHTNAKDKGHMLYMYYDKIMCSKPFAEIQTQQFQSAVSDIEGNQSNCTMTISTKGANKCWWYVYLCQDSCTRVEFRGNATKEWRTNVVTLPVHKGRNYVKIKATRKCYWMAVDDVYFSPSCFASDIHTSDVSWWIEIFVPVVCLLVAIEIIVVSWAVCQRTMCQERVCGCHIGSCFRRKQPEVEDFMRDSCVIPSSIAKYNAILTENNPNYTWLSERVLNECIRNIPYTKVRLDSLLGEGSFGKVYKGNLLKHGDTKDDTPVAVKKLSAGSQNESISDFLFEALTLSKFNHKNIVRCLGITSDPNGELLLVLELMEGGDLKNYLRRHSQREDLSVQELLKISVDIAHGCQYLEENRFIHRDIAARNCLLSTVDSNKIAKIGDFGFAKDIHGSEYYKKSEMAMAPVRWMPEESFKDGKFSSKSDVWAYGVLLWEIFSFGKLPYEDQTNAEVMAKVMNGHRLGQPRLCPIQVYNVMGECWNTEPDKRPYFKAVLTLLSSIYSHTFSQGTRQNTSGIFSRKVKQRLNTYSSPEDTETVTSLLDGDCKPCVTETVTSLLDGDCKPCVTDNVFMENLSA
ncbi:uncharacterized protein LOC125647380 [Ostrea edulis]|uniref:uncharacterized protein LOC125647380 n=1 Tax=Ostrea edulis TaxID=37623 RepID=UPI0024AEF21F|nr:uncharacterized protein LOC125647380 [Ostrea edulis]